MQISNDCVELVKEFEGLRLNAYPDPATGGDPITVGYGHTGPEVYMGMTITEEQAEEFLRIDLIKFVDKVNECLEQREIPQSCFDALVSFAFNCGPQNLRTSTLLKMVMREEYDGAALQFGRWNKAAGKEMAGLTRRRSAEADLFRTDLA